MDRADENLEEMLKKGIDKEKRRNYVSQIIQGLEYAHERKICHLDIKCQNILYLNGMLKIADWGSAKQSYDDKTMTIREGTAMNMSLLPPEVIEGVERINFFKVDIYNLGLVICRILYGKINLDLSKMLKSLGNTKKAYYDTEVQSIVQLLKNENCLESWEEKLLKRMLQYEFSLRPTIQEVVQEFVQAKSKGIYLFI